MVHITKVYTRQGDQGETHLAGGHRVLKNSVRIVAVGDVDELNSLLGFALTASEHDPSFADVVRQGQQAQQRLFNLGAQLVVLPQDVRPNTPQLTQADIDALEAHIDIMNQHLSPLQSFILPGGGEAAIRFHLARTVCRRAERSVLTLSQTVQLNPILLAYLNRLSDWLFVGARYVAKIQAQEELLWEPAR